MDLLITSCLISGLFLLAFSAGQFIAITRKETHMPNSSAIIAANTAAILASLKAKDDEIASLKAQIAAAPGPAPVDATEAADLAADETEIANQESALKAAGVIPA